MPGLDLRPSTAELEENLSAHRETEYVGRELMMGREGNMIMQVYVLTGRSQNSRDREFVREDSGGIRTAAPGKSAAQMRATPQANLIYYRVMAARDRVHVVSNGAQTDPVLHIKSALKDVSLKLAVQSAPVVDGVDLSSYEPDSLNTPRITGAVDVEENSPMPFALAIVRKNPDNDDPIYSDWEVGSLDELPNGVAYGIRTYQGAGDPPQPFDGEPYALPLEATPADTAELYVENTDPVNLVALVVKGIDRATGHVSYVIKNGLQTA